MRTGALGIVQVTALTFAVFLVLNWAGFPHGPLSQGWFQPIPLGEMAEHAPRLLLTSVGCGIVWWWLRER